MELEENQFDEHVQEDQEKMSLRVNHWELHVDGLWLHARIAHRLMDWGQKIACGLAEKSL